MIVTLPQPSQLGLRFLTHLVLFLVRIQLTKGVHRHFACRLSCTEHEVRLAQSISCPIPPLASISPFLPKLGSRILRIAHRCRLRPCQPGYLAGLSTQNCKNHFTDILAQLFNPFAIAVGSCAFKQTALDELVMRSLSITHISFCQ